MLQPPSNTSVGSPCVICTAAARIAAWCGAGPSAPTWVMMHREMTIPARPLRRILGLGFGLALVFGTMVGVGILRLPGMVAAALGDRTLIMLTWTVGGLFALMGAVSVAELAAMFPEAGGFRIYARRAFGEGVGFAVGWLDWLVGVATIAFA